MPSKMLVSVRFEVFGKVQGVFFRKYTKETATKLGLRGFVKNTDNGTVIGLLEGEETGVQEMKTWLSKTGSPSSRIEKCVFTEEQNIDKFKYSAFNISR